jgi:drug/metabolite transporter (DMT)-like permease
MTTRLFSCLLASAVLAAAGQLMFKVGATGRESAISYVNSWILAGLFSYLAGTMLWIYSLSKAYLTVVYPFTALTFALVYLFGILVLDEPTTLRAIAGVGLVLAGLFLISMG